LEPVFPPVALDMCYEKFAKSRAYLSLQKRGTCKESHAMQRKTSKAMPENKMA